MGHLKDAQEEMELDMTPMIDVVFLLIIFFICIDFKVLEAKLPAYLPKDVGTATEKAEPQEKLRIQIVCDNPGTPVPRYPNAPAGDERARAIRLEGHRIRWTVGPKEFNSVEKLLAELKRVRALPSTMQKDPKTGAPKVMTVVIEPGPDTVYGDVAVTVDAVQAADFSEINFGGGLKGKNQGGALRRP